MKITTLSLCLAACYGMLSTQYCVGYTNSNSSVQRPTSIAVNTSNVLFNKSFQTLDVKSAIAAIKSKDPSLYNMLLNLKPNNINSDSDKNIVLTFKKIISNVDCASCDLTQLSLADGTIIQKVKTSGKNNNCLLHSLITTHKGLGLKDGYKDEESFAKHLRIKLKQLWCDQAKIQDYTTSNLDAKKLIKRYLSSNTSSQPVYFNALELILKYFLQTDSNAPSVQDSDNIQQIVSNYLDANNPRQSDKRLDYLASEVKKIASEAVKNSFDVENFVSYVSSENNNDARTYYNENILPSMKLLKVQLSYVNRLASYVMTALNEDKNNNFSKISQVTDKDYLDYTYHLPVLLIYLRETYDETFNVILIRNPQKLMHFHRQLHNLYMNGFEFDRTMIIHHDKSKVHFSAYK